MPYVNVKLAGGPISAQEKQEVIAGITQVLHSALGKDPAKTYVVIEEVDLDSWGVGGESLSIRRARQES